MLWCALPAQVAPVGFKAEVKCLSGWPGESVAGTLSLRVQQLDVAIDTKTKDNVFVRMVRVPAVFEQALRLALTQSLLRKRCLLGRSCLRGKCIRKCIVLEVQLYARFTWRASSTW